MKKEPSDLFLANLEALKEVLSEKTIQLLHDYQPKRYVVGAAPVDDLDGPKKGNSKGDGIGYLDGERHVFDCDASVAALRTVESFLSRPRRLFLPPFSAKAAKVTPYLHYRFAEKLEQELGTMLAFDSLEQPHPGGGSLLVLGFGLGLTISHLIRELNFRNLYLVIEHPDSLWWSLHLLPWQSIVQEVHDRKGVLGIGFPNDSYSSATQIAFTLRDDNLALNDGSYLFVDPAFPMMQELAKKVESASQILYGTVGFFEDELLMERNAIGNLSSTIHRYYPGSSVELNSDDLPPALVVGNGPSLDRDIETIKKYKDHFIIFAAGSAEHTLQSRGIKAHFHCFLENDHIYEKEVETDINSGHLDFSDTCLIAPYTVSPGLTKFFKDIFLYHRELVVPSRFWAEKEDILTLTTPSVSNLACATAAALGFREIFLVGVDLGGRLNSPVHATGGYYDRYHDWTDNKPLTIPIEGNFTDGVFTNSDFQMTKQNLESLANSRPDIIWRNVSDGARILGFDPARLSTLCKQLRSFDHVKVMTLLREAWPKADLKQDDINEKLRPFVIQARDHLSELNGILAHIRSTDGASLEKFHDAAAEYLVPTHKDLDHSVKSAVRATFSGTLLAAIRHGVYYEKRIPTQDRARFLEGYWKTFEWFLEEMGMQFEEAFSFVSEV